ncbi:hypothetical protein [Paenibacillus rigui]|nr:hypothetical protein [Paenibacillus rigui]
MAKNKNKKSQQNDTEFSEEVVANNVKQPAQNNPSQGANNNTK